MNWLLFLKNEMKIDWSHPEDLEGTWRSEKGYSITFNDEFGILSNLDPLLYPKKLEGNFMYTELKFLGFGEWKAKRFNWKYPPNYSVSEGSWMFETDVTLQLTADKNAITDQCRVFRKVKKT